LSEVASAPASKSPLVSWVEVESDMSSGFEKGSAASEQLSALADGESTPLPPG
jgi:hypothetical protein